jgi:tRNA A37 threonylcarbamoyladenosine modification protein TsaB
MTWSTLALLGEHTKTFDKAGPLKMKNLLFWAGSQEARQARARTLAVQMDATFRELFGSKYEAGSNKSRAIIAMTAVLLQADQTVEALADADDALYLFMGEAAR